MDTPRHCITFERSGLDCLCAGRFVFRKVNRRPDEARTQLERIKFVLIDEIRTSTTVDLTLELPRRRLLLFNLLDGNYEGQK